MSNRARNSRDPHPRLEFAERDCRLHAHAGMVILHHPDTPVELAELATFALEFYARDWIAAHAGSGAAGPIEAFLRRTAERDRRVHAGMLILHPDTPVAFAELATFMLGLYARDWIAAHAGSGAAGPIEAFLRRTADRDRLRAMDREAPADRPAARPLESSRT